ncbi:hypothetical protein EJB05_34228 [Eragrostis curvula]|uniref:Uncharacterized protein n=1 Tax=Eragrostis curvula TaxID=38414 RepID=A0A5J9U4V0_9POAL|nr:hypothetical protein EJB05_34228 [Eragrostis curvula]
MSLGAILPAALSNPMVSPSDPAGLKMWEEATRSDGGCRASQPSPSTQYMEPHLICDALPLPPSCTSARSTSLPEIKECQYIGHAKCKLDNGGVINRSLGHEDTEYLEMIYSGAVY